MKTIQELISLKGRVALVTGGAGHIGQAICETLAELGAAVVVLDVNSESTKESAARIANQFGVECAPLVVDLADQQAVQDVPAPVLDRFGRLDILVNNAAFVGTSNLEGWVSPFKEQLPETWRKALEVNLTAPFVLTQACSEILAESGHGSIINISSIYGMVAPDMSLYDDTEMGHPAAYGTSKAGLLQLTRWLATVMAPDIRVNALTPGGVFRNQPDIFVTRYRARTPLGRMASEEDFKGAIAYLASDLSTYVTGQNLVVDGGWTIW
jgi:NAD(P)-dependent dehydrogenase (short-subunit alcohol dehydrogenase family)